MSPSAGQSAAVSPEGEGSWTDELKNAARKTNGAISKEAQLSTMGGRSDSSADAAAVAPAASFSSATTAATSNVSPSNPELIDPANYPPTEEGLRDYLSLIDGARPMTEGAVPDNTTATFKASENVAAGTFHEIPIPVWTAGSKVTIVRAGVDDEHSEGFDIEFGVSLTSTSSNDNGKKGGDKSKQSKSVVYAPKRITTIGGKENPKSEPISFVVSHVPATILLKFDNSYSWINSKRVLYHLEVHPPIDQEMIERSHRAEMALDVLAVDLNAMKNDVAKIDEIHEQMEKKAKQIQDSFDGNQKVLEDKVKSFKESLNHVKEAELAMNNKEMEMDTNAKMVGQLHGEKLEIEAQIDQLQKQLQAAEEALVDKVEAIGRQQYLVQSNKAEVDAMEHTIEQQLTAVEKAGVEIKETEEQLQAEGERNAEAANELALVTEEQEKATAHLKFYKSLSQGLQLRLMEKPQEI